MRILQKCFSYKFPFDLLFFRMSYFYYNFIVNWYPVCFFRTLHIMWSFEKQLNHIIIFTTLIYDINFLKPDPVKSLTWTWNFHHTTSLLFLENTISFFIDECFSVFFHVNVNWTLYTLLCLDIKITMPVSFLNL